MRPWKALGLDRFPSRFYQKYWRMVLKKVCELVMRLWSNLSEIMNINHTYTFLIPKVEQPQMKSQLSPISLCNVIYKLLSKVVVNRLKACIPKLVSPYKVGFVPGRNIHENIIIFMEIMHSMQNMKSGKGDFIIKVELSKAYHKFSYNFILRVL